MADDFENVLTDWAATGLLATLPVLNAAGHQVGISHLRKLMSMQSVLTAAIQQQTNLVEGFERRNFPVTSADLTKQQKRVARAARREARRVKSLVTV